MFGRLDRLFKKPALWFGAGVALLTLAPYLQTARFELINFDDHSYVSCSPVAKGLSWENLKWAMTDYQTMANWHPLTYLSLMSDVSLFGIDPGAMHLVNAGLHALAAVMLFAFLVMVLRKVETGAASRAAIPGSDGEARSGRDGSPLPSADSDDRDVGRDACAAGRAAIPGSNGEARSGRDGSPLPSADSDDRDVGRDACAAGRAAIPGSDGEARCGRDGSPLPSADSDDRDVGRECVACACVRTLSADGRGLPSLPADLRLLTAAALAALCWSLHPLRVESVAWISSRKDVLSVLFCLGGLIAHLSDVRRWQGGRERETEWRRLLDDTDAWLGSWRWWVGLLCFALGYMAKPTMMVFPALVALVEWLAAGRVRWRSLAVYAGGAVGVLTVTVLAQEAGGAVVADYPLAYRALNAAVSISVYVRQIVWPSGLIMFYPYDDKLPPGAILSGAAAVAGLAALALGCWRRLPVVTCGVAWFLAALFPVLGFIQVGRASHADRYTYLATLGVSLMLAVGLRGLLGKGRRLAWTAAVAAVAAAVLGTCAWRLAGQWRDDPTLSGYILSVSEDNYLANRNMGIYYYGRVRDCKKAAAYFGRALRSDRERNRCVQLFYIMMLAEAGELSRAKEEARDLAEYKERSVVKAMNPAGEIQRADTSTRLLDTFQAYSAIAYYEGDTDLARQHAETIIGYSPNDDIAHYLLGLMERDAGRLDEAIKHWKISAEAGEVTLRPFIKGLLAELEKQAVAKKPTP